MAKKTAMTTPKEMLDALLLDCIDLDNGYLRCRHCRASSYPKEAMLHEDECVVGQILLRRVGAPARAAEWQPLREILLDMKAQLADVAANGIPDQQAVEMTAATYRLYAFLHTHDIATLLPPGALAGDSNSKT